MRKRILVFPPKGKGGVSPWYSIALLHLILLFNVVTLLSGLVLATVLGRRWMTGLKPVDFWRFVHFLGFTFTLAVAALDAYAPVNRDLGATSPAPGPLQ
jgi:hypothetical protein